MNLRTSIIERAVRSCVSSEAKRNAGNAYRMLHFVEDLMIANRENTWLQSRQEIVQASSGDLPGLLQSEGLLFEGHLGHLRQWLNEEITFAVVAADAKHGYRAVNAIEKESFPVSEAHKAIINRAKASLDSEAAKKDKAASNSSSYSKGGRGRGRGVARGRGRGFQPQPRYNYNNYNNNSGPGPMRCVICNKTGHLANSCYAKYDKNDPKGPAGRGRGVPT